MGFIQQDASGASALLGSNIPITSVARQRQMAQWLVNYVNDHGGINGRKIIPTFETVSATSQDPQRVAACEAMAQDQHDEAVMDMNEMLTDDTYGCFARNHVDFFGNAADTDEEYLRAHAPYVTTTDMALNRQMTALVDGANRVHFLSGQKVGIILPDIPEAHRDYAPYLGAPLARLGIHPLVRYITETTGGAQTAQTDNAELAFATAGVTRVLFIHDIIVYLAFTSQASAEHYHPHYAYPDFAGAAGVAAYYGSTSTNTGSIAVSAVPSSVPPTDKYDEKSAGQTKIHRSQLTPGARKCLDIMSKESGVNWYDPKQSQDPDLDAIYYCDEFFLFVKAASAVPGGYTPATLGQGLQRVGSSYLSSHVESTDYSSGREDGAASYAVGLYNAKCSCFVRSTPWIPGP